MDIIDQDYMEKAEQQFIGFLHGRDGYSIESLCEAMGLTREEWEMLKNEFSIDLTLSKEDIEAIDAMFGKLHEETQQ